MASKNKTPFSQSARMAESYQLFNSLGLRSLFKDHENICVSSDPKRNCIVWIPVSKELFFKWVERRSDIYSYKYVVEITQTHMGSCVRIHAIERTFKTIEV